MDLADGGWLSDHGHGHMVILHEDGIVESEVATSWSICVPSAAPMFLNICTASTSRSLPLPLSVVRY